MLVPQSRSHSGRAAPTRSRLQAATWELQKVIPSFLTRVERPDRGGRWIDYLEARARAGTHSSEIVWFDGAFAWKLWPLENGTPNRS